jgi:hypothetical protein
MQQSSQFTITIWYASRSIVQSRDYVAQNKQRCVDATALGHACAFVIEHAVVLAASEIDQMQLANQYAAIGFGCADLHNKIN